LFSGAHNFSSLGPDWTSRFVSARRIRVSFLTESEFRPILERPVPEFNLRYAQETLELLFRLTRCQPHLTQAVAKELVDLMNDEKRWVATPDDVEHAARKAMWSAGEFFANVWFDARPEGQALLTALAQGQSPAAGPVR